LLPSPCWFVRAEAGQAMAFLAFDIETVPDVELGRRLLDLDELPDEDIVSAMTFRSLQQKGTEFLPLQQHRVVAISCALRDGDDLRVWSLGEPGSDEREIIQRFFDGIERYTPELVSWNGGGFDLPVLHYRAMYCRVSCARYWETGDDDRSFRYNNYLSRYHWRHVDLMDVLAGFQPRARARLDEIAVMLGFPGKMGLAGDQVWPFFRDGRIDAIRNYCETDVLNTWLVFLRFQHMRGLLDAPALEKELGLVREVLQTSEAAHLQAFLDEWKAR